MIWRAWRPNESKLWLASIDTVPTNEPSKQVLCGRNGRRVQEAARFVNNHHGRAGYQRTLLPYAENAAKTATPILCAPASDDTGRDRTARSKSVSKLKPTGSS